MSEQIVSWKIMVLVLAISNLYWAILAIVAERRYKRAMNDFGYYINAKRMADLGLDAGDVDALQGGDDE